MHIRYVYLLSGLLAYLAAAPIAIQFLPQADYVLVDLALMLVLVAGVRSLMGVRWMFRVGVTLAVTWVTLEVVYLFSQAESLVIRVYAEVCGLILAFLGSGGRNAATIFSLRNSSSR